LILIAPSGKNIPPHDDTRQYITFMSDNQYRKETKIARYKGVFFDAGDSFVIPSSLQLRKAGKTRYIFRMLRTALTLFRTFCRIGACKKEFTFLLLILLTTSTRRDILKTKKIASGR